MKKLMIAAVLMFAAVSGPAMAIVDDGSGCGCIRPCHIKSTKPLL